jgi:hypothetical protein
MPVQEMTRAECEALLADRRLARLACSSGDQPYVVPIFYVVEGIYLYSFTMPGKKLQMMRENPRVCVLVEEFSEGKKWRSVVIDGRYEELIDVGAKDHAWSLLQRHVNWWEPGGSGPLRQPVSGHSSHVFYRILIDSISGRRSTGGPARPSF